MIFFATERMAQSRAEKLSLDGDLNVSSTIDVKLRFTMNSSEHSKTMVDEYKIDLNTRHTFEIIAQKPRLVNGNVKFQIRQIDRFYLGEFKSPGVRAMIADTQPPNVPVGAFIEARGGNIVLGLKPSLAWPESIYISAERMPQGGYVDFQISGKPSPLRDVISFSMELDMLRNWMAIRLPKIEVTVGEKWKGQALRFPFLMYGNLQLTPDYEITEIRRTGVRPTAHMKLSVSTEGRAFAEPVDPNIRVEGLLGDMVGEVVYDLEGKYIKSAIYQVMYSVKVKPAEGIKPWRTQKFSLWFDYVRR